MEEITRLAESFVEKMNKEKSFHADYEYSLDAIPKEYFECWYFDFKIRAKREGKDPMKEGFGGAPGFIISKNTKKAEVIPFWKKIELEEGEERKTELDKVLSQIDAGGWSVKLIRELTGIELSKILKLKDNFSNYDFSKEENRILVVQEIERLKNKAPLLEACSFE